MKPLVHYESPKLGVFCAKARQGSGKMTYRTTDVTCHDCLRKLRAHDRGSNVPNSHEDVSGTARRNALESVIREEKGMVHYKSVFSDRTACRRAGKSSPRREGVTCKLCLLRLNQEEQTYKDYGNYDIKDDMVGAAQKVHESDKKTSTAENKSYFQKLAGMLREANDVTPDAAPEKEDGEESLDAQVDRYLAEYESEAKSAKTEGLDWRRTVRRIIEAGDDADTGGDDTADDVDQAPEEPKKMSENDIDVESFANSVVRLIENYDSLLEVRNTLLRRASNFLSKNYAVEVVEKFKENLRGEHGIEIGKSPEDVADEEFKAPTAARAGDGGAGGGPA